MHAMYSGWNATVLLLTYVCTSKMTNQGLMIMHTYVLQLDHAKHAYIKLCLLNAGEGVVPRGLIKMWDNGTFVRTGICFAGQSRGMWDSWQV